MKVAMRPRDIAPAPDWIGLVLFLASICFIYAIFGWIGVAPLGVAVAAVVAFLTILPNSGWPMSPTSRQR
jgi:hypothetical protein